MYWWCKICIRWRCRWSISEMVRWLETTFQSETPLFSTVWRVLQLSLATSSVYQVLLFSGIELHNFQWIKDMGFIDIIDFRQTQVKTTTFHWRTSWLFLNALLCLKGGMHLFELFRQFWKVSVVQYSNNSHLITHDVCFKKQLGDTGSQGLWFAVRSIELF